MRDEILFSESQRFRQWWFWVLMIFINGLFLFGLFQQLLIKQPFGDKPMSDLGLILVFLFVAALTFSFVLVRLETQIKEDGIHVRFFPLQIKFRFYPWGQIENVYLRKYKAIVEYGGWGMRGLGKNRALNISGNDGLQLVLKENKKLLIGTRKPEEIETVLKKLNKRGIK